MNTDQAFDLLQNAGLSESSSIQTVRRWLREGKIKYEGRETDNPLAFRWYDENKVVAGKPMKEWLRFACAYWHSFCGNGADPFGEPTHIFPWNDDNDPVVRAQHKADAAF